MILDPQYLLPLALPPVPPAVLDDGTPRCSACAIPLNIPGDHLSDDWGGECRYCITKAVDDALDFATEAKHYEMIMSALEEAAA